jgi:hypothetical protein
LASAFSTGSMLSLATKSDTMVIVSTSISRGSLELENQDCHLFSYGFVQKGRN